MDPNTTEPTTSEAAAADEETLQTPKVHETASLSPVLRSRIMLMRLRLREGQIFFYRNGT
jgi:hypothetical protein